MLNKVLVVDDSELIHNMFRLIFKRVKDCKVVTASNGVEALKKLSEDDEIQLILLDINMPLMDGITFLDVVQREKIFDKIPIIVVSTEGKEEDTIKALKMGAKGYVKKPFKPNELFKLIQQIYPDINV
jgi:two-component system, chemotaxis family, chemotaxis protein CheY